MHIKFLRENQSSFSFPATDDIPWVPAGQLAKLNHYRLVSNAAGFFLQNKSCLKLSLFCIRTDDWLNFHVKFQSIHVNITSTAHHFFFPPFFLLYISKTCQTQKKPLSNSKQMLTYMCTNALKKKHFLHAFNSFQPEWLLNVMWNMRYMSCETCVTIQRTSEVEEVFQ